MQIKVTLNNLVFIFLQPRTHEKVFLSKLLLEVSETNIKAARLYTRHSKVHVTGCPLYSYAEIRVLLLFVGGGGAACSLKYKRGTKTFLETKMKI